MYEDLTKKLERPCNYIVQHPGDRWTKVDIYDIQEAIAAIKSLTVQLAEYEAAERKTLDVLRSRIHGLSFDGEKLSFGICLRIVDIDEIDLLFDEFIRAEAEKGEGE